MAILLFFCLLFSFVPLEHYVTYLRTGRNSEGTAIYIIIMCALWSLFYYLS